VVMADNLGQALVKLLGSRVLADTRLAAQAAMTRNIVEEDETKAATPSTATTTSNTPSSATVLDLSQSSLPQLITLANEQYTRATEAQRNGNWAEYGTQIAELQATLQQMTQVMGVQPVPIDAATAITLPETTDIITTVDAITTGDVITTTLEASGVVTP
jgi:hypothetical protein